MSLRPCSHTLMRIVRSTYDDLSAPAKDMVDAALLSLIDGGSHILSIEINRLFLVQVLSRRHATAKERALLAMHAKSANPLLRRMLLHALANWDCGYFVKEQLRSFSSMSPLERRALLVSSFCLGMKAGTGARTPGPGSTRSNRSSARGPPSGSKPAGRLPYDFRTSRGPRVRIHLAYAVSHAHTRVHELLQPTFRQACRS